MEVSRSLQGNGTSSLGNSLNSDVLRARTLEYYNSCLPQTPRQGVRDGAPHKNGTMAQVNDYPNGISISPKFSVASARTPYSDRSVTRVFGARPLPPLYMRNDRPHRTHSERASRSPGELRIGQGSAAYHCSPNKFGLYRSNSSLDLDHGEELEDRTGVLRRDYGSASSLDVIGASSDSFFAMLREYRSENMDQRSPGPAKIHEYLRGKLDPAPSTQNASNALANGSDGLEESQSPKLKTKFHRLLEIKDRGKMRSKMLSSEPSIFRKLRGSKADATESGNKGSDTLLDAENRLEEKLRKKAFAHYDCQSLTANLNYASRLRSLLSKRRNTTTGASAASMIARGSTEAFDPEDPDPGDGRNSELVLSCPFFRNELGGEDERIISLSRITCRKQRNREDSSMCPPTLHRPSMACGLAVLEKANGVRWKKRSCPYQRPSLNIESVDSGALYYRNFFHGQEHQNWFGIDENLGPVAISIRREKVEEPILGPTVTSNESHSSGNNNSLSQYQYRLILRTSELAVLRGTVLEEAIPALNRSSPPRGCHAKEVLEYVAPELHLGCLRLGVPGLQTEDQLIKLDEQGTTKTYKVGVMYCKAGQSTEEDMYNNEHSGPAFEEFLEMLGQRVRLKGFDKYRAGLDNKTDTTGLYSVYAAYQDCEIMFHVSTMLPYTPNNRQQLLRKRHIGNDIVTIVFQEPDALPFTPKSIRSHFQHVFIIVRAISPCTDGSRYSIAVSRSKDVPVFGPAIPEGATFTKSKAFADFLLTKVINAENAAHRSEKFATMAQRTRQEYLKDLAGNYITHTTIDSGPRFSILHFGGKKKERSRPRFIPDLCIQSAVAWQVQVEDFGQSTVLDCVMGISSDTFVLIEESRKEIVFVSPCSSIIGWSSHTNSLKIFYHQGECIVLRTKDPDVDEIQEIVNRLMYVTSGCETQELILRRNSLGQLGFHVQYEGVVTEVENYGFAWQAGLRQGGRLVEICKVSAATLTYDQMVDLLKTSMTVTVTVIPPFPDGGPRRGCSLHNCSYLSVGTGAEYENVGSNMHGSSGCRVQGSVRAHNSAHPQSKVISRLEVNASKARSPDSSPRHLFNKTVASSLDFRHGRASGNHGGLSAKDARRETQQVHQSVVSLNCVGSSKESPPPPLPARLVPNSPSAFSQVTSGLNNGEEKNVHAPVSLSSTPSSVSYHEHHSSHSSHHPHQHHSYHDHSRREDNLVHVGGMVASRSELSLAHLGPSHSRSHSHHLTMTPNSASTSSKSSPPEYSFVSHLRVSQNEITLQPVVPSTLRDHGRSRSFSKALSSQAVGSDYHSDSSSEWHQGTSSADELSGGSQHSTPKNGLQKSEFSGDSRGVKSHSPQTAARTHSEPLHSKLSRLRPGVTSCSTRVVKVSSNHSVGASSSSSCSGSSSTLQEDLLKLISPDILDSDANSEKQGSAASQAGSIHSDCSPPTQSSTPYSSLERSGSSISGGGKKISQCNSSSDGAMDTGPQDDVILTKAHPAQVISSEPSSPAPTEQKLSAEERLSPRVTSDRVLSKLKPLVSAPSHQLIPLPDGKDIDWPSLVDTATRAIEASTMPTGKSGWPNDASDHLMQELSGSGTSSRHIHDLELTVRQLQQDLAKEQHHKASLENQVRQLQHENQRLQEESSTTAAQLRKFTEWFFQNIES